MFKLDLIPLNSAKSSTKTYILFYFVCQTSFTCFIRFIYECTSDLNKDYLYSTKIPHTNMATHISFKVTPASLFTTENSDNQRKQTS